MKRRPLPAGWRVALGLGLGLGCLAYTGWQVDRAQLGRHLADVALGWLGLAVLLDLVAFALRAAKWRVLLGGRRPVPYAVVFRTTVLGALATDVLPLRLDELVRAHLMARQTGASRSRVLGTIAVERTIDVAWLLVAVGGLVLFAAPPTWLLRGAAALGLMLLLAMGGLWWIGRGGRLRVPGRVGGLLDELLTGAQVPARRVALALAIGALEWLALLGLFTAVLAACGAPMALAPLLLTTSFFVFAVPLSPGAVGVYHAAVAAALSASGVPPALALSVGVVAHATVLAPTTALGTVFLAVEGLSPRSLICAARGDVEELAGVDGSHPRRADVPMGANA